MYTYTCTYFRFNRKLYYSITTNMDDEEKLYYIVEFSDGMQLIPSNWFTASKTKAYWPSFTNVKKYDKAVQSMESVGKNWILYDVLRILGSTRK